MSSHQQGPTHRARQNSKLPPVTFGPFVDELKRPVTEPVMKSSSQTLIVLLHYHIKSKEVWLCVVGYTWASRHTTTCQHLVCHRNMMKSRSEATQIRSHPVVSPIGSMWRENALWIAPCPSFLMNGSKSRSLQQHLMPPKMLLATIRLQVTRMQGLTQARTWCKVLLIRQRCRKARRAKTEWTRRSTQHNTIIISN